MDLITNSNVEHQMTSRGKSRLQGEGSRRTESSAEHQKTFIGVLATHEESRRHKELVDLLDYLSNNNSSRQVLANFSFVFTGGTFDRVLLGKNPPSGERGVTKKTRDFLEECGVIRLPRHGNGGVVILAYLVVQRRIGILWSFLTPTTSHWLQPENIALMRLCDHWHVNRLLNSQSVSDWWVRQSLPDSCRNCQDWPPTVFVVDSISPTSDGTFQIKPKKFESNGIIVSAREPSFPNTQQRDESKKRRQDRKELRLALIAHDEMKLRMIEFAVDYEHELRQNFSQIITTGTTGGRVKEAAPSLATKIVLCQSGPKGGDIQIATAIMLGLIDVVIFFIDPLHPHPHIDDIRVVFGACMMQPVRMLTNERQAREWMESAMVLSARK